jgi:ParB-like chromosome segregation protein Spo0J
MATTINAGDSRRTDLFHVNPFEIIVREENRGRHLPPSKEAIVAMAESLLDNQQQQPIQCRRDPVDKRLILNVGFTRTAAGRMIVKGFTDSNGVERKDEDFKLKVTLSDANDEQAFKNNIVENAHRNQTSPIDDAYNQKMCRDRYGMADAEIAKLYNWKGTAKVAQLRNLLSLETPIQLMIHEGTISIQAALDMLQLTPEKRAEIVEVATKQNNGGKTKITTSAVRDVVREQNDVSNDIINDANREHEVGSPNGASGPNTDNKTTVRTLPRTMKQVKEFLQQLADEGKTEGIKEICKHFKLFIEGKRTPKYVTDQFNKYCK